MISSGSVLANPSRIVSRTFSRFPFSQDQFVTPRSSRSSFGRCNAAAEIAKSTSFRMESLSKSRASLLAGVLKVRACVCWMSINGRRSPVGVAAPMGDRIGFGLRELSVTAVVSLSYFMLLLYTNLGMIVRPLRTRHANLLSRLNLFRVSLWDASLNCTPTDEGNGRVVIAMFVCSCLSGGRLGEVSARFRILYIES